LPFPINTYDYNTYDYTPLSHNNWLKKSEAPDTENEAAPFQQMQKYNAVQGKFKRFRTRSLSAEEESELRAQESNVSKYFADDAALAWKWYDDKSNTSSLEAYLVAKKGKL